MYLSMYVDVRCAHQLTDECSIVEKIINYLATKNMLIFSCFLLQMFMTSSEVF